MSESQESLERVMKSLDAAHNELVASGREGSKLDDQVCEAYQAAKSIRDELGAGER